MRTRVWIFVLGLIAACDAATDPVPQHTLEVVSGDQQIGGAGTRLPQAVVVRLTGRSGQPVRAATVTWRTIEGGGSIDEVVTTTDAEGRTSVEWTLGSDIGTQTLLAMTGSASLNIRATSRFEVSSVAAGYRHTCALSSTGDAFCWGANPQGELGNDTELFSSVPVRVQTQIRFRKIVAGWSHTCALSLAGEALCWGDNSVGQAGFASGAARSATPATVVGSDTFVDISIGFVHSCGLTATGDAVCWGVNSQGQLGGAGPGLVRITGQQFQAISAGEFHTCAVRSGNVAVCWGWNSTGELGTGVPFGTVVSAPGAVAANITFTDISAGARHTCAVATGGQAYCWGRNAVGETGQDPFVAAATPAQVPGGVAFTALGTGNTHTCALAGQRVYCWGSAPANGGTSATKFPTPLSSTLQPTSLSVGYAHSCGVANGEVWCWGSNSHGQLGQATVTESPAPVRVHFAGL